MKTLKKIGIAVLTSLFLASCVPLKSNGNRGLPPGQVKKVTGAKSAKTLCAWTQQIEINKPQQQNAIFCELMKITIHQKLILH